MYDTKTINKKIIGTLKILSIKTIGEIERVLNVYQLTMEDFMLNLTDQDMAELATMEKSGDFGPVNTYAEPGSEYAHLSDADLLAQLNNEGDFSSVPDPYRPDLIAETGNSTIFIQTKKPVLFPNIEQFFPKR